MKNHKVWAVALLTAVMGIASSCTDSDGPSCIEDYVGPIKANESVLLGDWTLVSIESDEEVDLTEDGEDNPSTDIFAQQGQCETDVVYSFKEDRSFEFKEGENVDGCNKGGTLKGTWQMGGTTLGLVYSCMQNIIELEFNPSHTTFSYSNRIQVRQENGKIVDAQWTYTFSNQPTVPEPQEPVEAE